MLNQDFKQALKVIYEKLKDSNIQYAVIGSTNLALQGMDFSPNDLDLVVELRNLEKIREIFQEYFPSKIRKLKPLTDEPGWEIQVKIKSVEVQILGEKFTGEYVRKLNQITKIKLDSVEIPCFTLEAEAQAYSETKRDSKAKLIQEFLNLT